MTSACSYTVTAGGYVLGVLTVRESNDFHDHIEVCSDCRREVVELSPVARMLAPLKTARRSAHLN
ncbi:hypothetical protein DMH04_21995 [Kibdelosporangium aridum]|uniref:Zinc-finger n=1 Tax=Kibdelosporangium aridum TaxID=2030 RepID=A0A428Z7R6_KIBAR|nr:hypothetical protein [Kibdelosporangium aridum]RSM83841.1 hypothetical protein DMH04_21995 [Kibdelosporangium aridum]